MLLVLPSSVTLLALASVHLIGLGLGAMFSFWSSPHEGSDLLPDDLSTESDTLETNSEALGTDSDTLGTDSGVLESEVRKTDSGAFKSESAVLKVASTADVNDSAVLSAVSEALKTDSGAFKANSGDLKTDSVAFPTDSGALRTEDLKDDSGITSSLGTWSRESFLMTRSGVALGEVRGVEVLEDEREDWSPKMEERLTGPRR